MGPVVEAVHPQFLFFLGGEGRLPSSVPMCIGTKLLFSWKSENVSIRNLLKSEILINKVNLWQLIFALKQDNHVKESKLHSIIIIQV